MPLYIAKSGDLEGCHACLTDRLTTLKDSATQLLIKYKSGALVTQFHMKLTKPFLSHLNIFEQRKYMICFSEPKHIVVF